MNPLAFRRGPVTVWTALIYLAVLIPIIVVNESVPPAPKNAVPFAGVNLTEAWLDLTTLTQNYHPFNSRANDQVRDWLLLRIQEMLDQNGASWSTEGEGGATTDVPSVAVFNDVVSNFTHSMDQSRVGTNAPSRANGGIAAYYEGTNIMVYIRGTDDEEGEWWKKRKLKGGKLIGKGGTLINAHYDSVSTGYGATDNGMGVVSVLQVIKYFTTPGHQPKRGIVALLNNGEEDFLYGARAFGQSPLLNFVHTFLNVEGAGAGGRALLFRSSDQQVTAAYARTKHPFGTVIGSDAFGLGVIASQTDYVVLNGIFGQRGLDLAFFKPRARYHTDQDDAKHTSRASLWHMLSASVDTMINLSGDTGNTFIGPRPDDDHTKVQNGSPSDGVWFDIFGSSFVLFNLRGMFAWSLTVLIVTPLILALITYLLVKADRYYFFTSKVKTDDDPDLGTVSIGGWKGFFRFPFALAFATALTFGAAFLLRKVNPLIVYSSPYTVWATMFSLFFFGLWLILRGASAVRPSALHRGYVNIWLFVVGWAALVAVTVLEDRFRIASGYLFVFFQSAVFLSTLITLVELFALPKKTEWAQQARDEHSAREQMGAVPHSEDLIAPTPGEAVSPTAAEANGDDEEDSEPPSETTPLVGGPRTENARTTFATTYRRSISRIQKGVRKATESRSKPIEDEQPWSVNLPSWTWIFQFLLIGPFIIILASQIGLTVTDALYQTGSDGSSLLLPYLMIAAFSVLVLLPLSPFIHRVTHHIPIFLLVVSTATMIYDLAAFPFSAENRYKAYFLQHIDLDTGNTTTQLTGLEAYIRPVIAELPSAAGQVVACNRRGARRGTVDCSFDSAPVAPRLGGLPDGVPPQEGYADLVSINVTRGEGNKARIEIDAVETKACFLHFDRPVGKLEVVGGAGWDERFGRWPEDGVGLVKLWRRDWGKSWVVDVEWTDKDVSASSASSASSAGEGEGEAGEESVDGGELRVRSGLEGYVACQWSDANTPGVIPALDEVLKYAPAWAGVSKLAEGLVEGRKRFMV
ncbi:Peptide hydrolase [Coniochaeta hoffmannii]|uniref:Peptide hydrolase n=1 Tax=Coniochaeta hoffmannii TaxID=91930 RepID=A0AA38VHI3_9PEZI|nr:Peptide hydrolase [Coniochaeta hoffmannii]